MATKREKNTSKVVAPEVSAAAARFTNEEQSDVAANPENYEIVGTGILDSATIDDMTPEEVGQAIEAAANEAVDKGKRGKKAEPPQTVLQDVLPTNANGTITVPLSSLIPLDHTTIPNAKLAMREINQEHREHLKIAYKRGDVIPPIEVRVSNMGNIAVDGYHRWAAMEDVVSELALADDLEAKRQALMIEVKPLNGLDENQVVLAAFQANLKNGLPASDASRARYAMYLLRVSKETGQKFGYPKKFGVYQAAEMAGVSHVAVYRLMGRIAEKEKQPVEKMVDNFGTPEEATEAATLLGKEAADKEVDSLKSATSRLFGAFKTIVSITDNPESLANYFESTGLMTDEMAAYADTLIQALSVTRPTSVTKPASQPATTKK